MNRLTQHTPTGASLILDEPKNDAEAREQVMQKFKLAVNVLAAYEDTKLTPEEIESLQTQLAASVSPIPCCECGGEVVEFTVPNDIWNLVMRPDGKETDREYLCWNCWYEKLRNKMAEMQRRERNLEDALLGMAHQFCSDGERMQHMFMSAEELAFAVLDIKNGEKVSKVYKRYEKKWRGVDGEGAGQ